MMVDDEAAGIQSDLHATKKSCSKQEKPSSVEFAREQNPCSLDFAAEQLANHTHGTDAHRAPQSIKIEGAEESVGKAKGQHGGNVAASILQRPAALVHLVLLGFTKAQVVLIARLVDLFAQRTCRECPLQMKIR